MDATLDSHFTLAVATQPGSKMLEGLYRLAFAATLLRSL
jgi:hypothetical protein